MREEERKARLGLLSTEAWGVVLISKDDQWAVLLRDFIGARRGPLIRLWDRHMAPFGAGTWETSRRKGAAKFVRVTVSVKDPEAWL